MPLINLGYGGEIDTRHRAILISFTGDLSQANWEIYTPIAPHIINIFICQDWPLVSMQPMELIDSGGIN